MKNLKLRYSRKELIGPDWVTVHTTPIETIPTLCDSALEFWVKFYSLELKKSKPGSDYKHDVILILAAAKSELKKRQEIGITVE